MPLVQIDPGRFDAVVFDMDGVVTDTAGVHSAAWKRLFDDFLQERARREGSQFQPFTQEDYLRYVDGRRREDGVDGFLRSRGIELPWDEESADASGETITGLGRRKNGYFLDAIADGVRTYPSTVALVHTLHEAGLATAIISASRNLRAVLNGAGIGDLFPVAVDGQTAADLGIPGKPDPAVFLEAARRVSATPARTAVVEDAVSGVTAGRRGDFALVIGVDRGGNRALLAEAGADVVVDDLAEVAVGVGEGKGTRR
ncbi:MAG: HAD family hydrolase [Frankiaceae bacterium]